MSLPDTPSTLPVEVDQVTAEWASKALGHPVKELTLKQAMHGTASKLLYKVTYEDEDSTDNSARPSDICVKGGFNPQLVALHPALTAVYRREADFYARMAPELAALGMRLPKSWYNGVVPDRSDGQGIVVVDDLTASGNTFGDPLEPWPVDRVRKGVEQLAIMHAATWGADPAEYAWLIRDHEASASEPDDKGTDLREVILGLMSPPAWEVRFGPGHPPVPPHMMDRERMVRAFKTLWFDKTKAGRDALMRCVVHGDSHIGNTYVTPDGEPAFLDWQAPHVHSALHDVAYFIIGSLTVDDRRANEVSLFEHYLDTLHAKGGPRFGMEEVWDDYRRHVFHGFAWSLTPPMMQPQDKVDAMTVRHCAAIVDHGTLELLEASEGYVTEV